MNIALVAAETSTASLVLRYSAAFFFVLVAIALAYVLFKAAKTLERLDKVLVDVDENGIPLMRKAGETLDGVNANLSNVDEITKDVAGITDKIDTMSGWEDIVYDYAVFKAKRKDRDPTWQEAKAIYDGQLQFMFNKTSRFTDQGDQFTSGVPNWPLYLYADTNSWY